MFHTVRVSLIAVITAATLLVGQTTFADMMPIFEDDFENGADALWGNERGGWIVDNGKYRSTSPNNNPQSISMLPFDLEDFVIDVDIENVQDGGVWLRAEFDGNNNPVNGVLLVTGGYTGTFGGFYFHTVTNGSFSGALGQTGTLFTPGVSDINVRILVEDDLYQVFLNGDFQNPVTSINYGSLTSGQVGLYDYSAQSFDNFQITPIPEPGSLCLLGLAGITMLCRRLRQVK